MPRRPKNETAGRRRMTAANRAHDNGDAGLGNIPVPFVPAPHRDLQPPLSPADLYDLAKISPEVAPADDAERQLLQSRILWERSPRTVALARAAGLSLVESQIDLRTLNLRAMSTTQIRMEDGPVLPGVVKNMLERLRNGGPLPLEYPTFWDRVTFDFKADGTHRVLVAAAAGATVIPCYRIPADADAENVELFEVSVNDDLHGNRLTDKDRAENELRFLERYRNRPNERPQVARMLGISPELFEAHTKLHACRIRLATDGKRPEARLVTDGAIEALDRLPTAAAVVFLDFLLSSPVKVDTLKRLVNLCARKRLHSDAEWADHARTFEKEFADEYNQDAAKSLAPAIELARSHRRARKPQSTIRTTVVNDKETRNRYRAGYRLYHQLRDLERFLRQHIELPQRSAEQLNDIPTDWQQDTLDKGRSIRTMLGAYDARSENHEPA